LGHVTIGNTETSVGPAPPMTVFVVTSIGYGRPTEVSDFYFFNNRKYRYRRCIFT
jgi:hypothetical protein